MTATATQPTATTPAVTAAAEATRGDVPSFINDVFVLTKRNLVHIKREPMQLSDVTAQPVLFTLLFIYIFGAGITVPGGGNYKDFAVAGLLALNLTTSSTGTAVGLSTDLMTGMLDRFRTLPMWRSAVLIGRTLSDVLSAALCVTIVLITGYVIGWRPDHGFIGVLEGAGVALLFSYSVTWAMACIGMVSPSPESATGVGLLVLFPLAFVSNAMVPTQHMPSVLRVIANWNPVSAMTSACRDLFGNPNPSSTIHAWPMQHPLAATLLWSVVLLGVFVPLASFLFQRRTTD
jgi:ABC-2 type transport system permease protein